MRTLIKRTDDQWLDIFNRHHTSGIGLEEFCADNDIVASTFYGARRRLIDSGRFRPDAHAQNRSGIAADKTDPTPQVKKDTSAHWMRLAGELPLPSLDPVTITIGTLTITIDNTAGI